jgi:hypothetical protein
MDFQIIICGALIVLVLALMLMLFGTGVFVHVFFRRRK